jgi:hypothetical protein
VRTASILAGPCHYNGEVVTTGCDALLAWDIASGVHNGVDLTGVRVAAAITSDQNLGDAQGARQAQIVIDEQASAVQVNAVMDLLHNRFAAVVGDIRSTRRSAVRFEHGDDGYVLSVPGFGSFAIRRMTDGECCKQPNQVWYSPLFPMSKSSVGFTSQAKFIGGSGAAPWERANENGSFYGTFAF